MSTARPGGVAWSRLSDEKLLNLRPRDLGLQLSGSDVEPAVEQLYLELSSHGIRFRPHVWLSDEFFTPDGVPGIAVPFYLAHPRLTSLERSQMLEVEGGTHDWCMRILRHEAGHALDNAYRLHRRKRYLELFGRYHEPYPESYRPRPYTKRYVVHLDMWYAQSHPAEDFAETFAVWLNPRSDWRRQYEGWPALRKLQYVQQLMAEVGPMIPPVRTRRRTHTLRTLRLTLRQHYQKKQAYYCRGNPCCYDRDLRRLFSAEFRFARRSLAADFLEQIRPEARMMISRWTGAPQLTIDRTIADMTASVRLLGLRLCKPARQTKTDVMLMLAVQTMNYLTDSRRRIVL